MKFFHVYATTKGYPQEQVEKDIFELCLKHWDKKYNPEIYKKYSKNS